MRVRVSPWAQFLEVFICLYNYIMMNNTCAMPQSKQNGEEVRGSTRTIVYRMKLSSVGRFVLQRYRDSNAGCSLRELFNDGLQHDISGGCKSCAGHIEYHSFLKKEN